MEESKDSDIIEDSPSRDRWRITRELLVLFIRMGAVAFGGPVAHVALMEREIVHRRGWLDRGHFMDLLALTNLVPGPNSTQMIMHVGFVRGGDWGTWIAGLAFILPAFAITLALSWLYVALGTLPAMEALFFGIKPVIVALIATALWRMTQKEIRNLEALILFAGAAVLAALGTSEILVMALGGLWGLGRALKNRYTLSMLPLVSWVTFAGGTGSVPEANIGTLALLFLRFGATLYGSGYLLIAFIQNDLVGRLGWLTNQQLLDAIALGQMTPGPILTTSTAVGYIVAGVPGAIVSTAAIFLPSFFFVMWVGRWMERLRNSPVARSILDGILPAVLGVILVVAWRLGQDALVDPFSVVVALVAGVALVRWKVDSIILIVIAAAFGYVWHIFL